MLRALGTYVLSKEETDIAITNIPIKSHLHKTLFFCCRDSCYPLKSCKCIENMYLSYVMNPGNTCSLKGKDKYRNHNTLIESHWHKTLLLVAGTVAFH
jgi:hypothetical protein